MQVRILPRPQHKPLAMLAKNERMKNGEVYFGFASVKTSTKQMADVMYALLMVGGRLHGSMGTHLDRYDRKQNCTHKVDCVFELPLDKVYRFEELSGLVLKTSEEFQGVLTVNTSK